MRKNNLEFIKKKYVVMFLHDYKCYLCARHNLSLHVHHLDNNGSNHDAFNLLPLCVVCHQKVHKYHFVINYQPDSILIASLLRLNALFGVPN